MPEVDEQFVIGHYMNKDSTGYRTDASCLVVGSGYMRMVFGIYGVCRTISLVVLYFVIMWGPGLCAATSESSFHSLVLPFIEEHCIECHSGEKPKAKFDISGYRTIDSVRNDPGHWKLILDLLKEGEMPPEDEPQPSKESRDSIIQWIESFKMEEAERNAGDPGIVLARRLSNSEYDYTIRDLTGVDIQPTREFPVDPANQSGFDNTGESLTLSPALLKKYLAAARHVANHLVLNPEGIHFASHPVVTDTDKDKYCVKRIIDFYQRFDTDLAGYFHASWKLKHGLDGPGLDVVAGNHGLSARYLDTVYQLLKSSADHFGPIAQLRDRWNDLPGPELISEEEVRIQCEKLRDKVKSVRENLVHEFPNLKVRGINASGQALVLWRNRQYANHRRSLDLDRLMNYQSDTEHSDSWLRLSDDPGQREMEIAAFKKFCSIIPDMFVKSERGREFLDPDENRDRQNKGRFLSAGFHSMLGYFRDDSPLYELILSPDEQKELDALWLDLDVFAGAPIRQHKSLVWFERTDSSFMRNAEFDFARAEDKNVISEEIIQRLGEVYLAKAIRSGADMVAAQAIEDHFKIINRTIRDIEKRREASEPEHLEAVINFAERAMRRPLSDEEIQDWKNYYRALRNKDGVTHEDAIEDMVVAVLMSPHFWYRFNIPGDGQDIQPLDDYELASRLSYFLWSSMPDKELMELADQGKLSDPSVLTAQAGRMIRDAKIRALAVEFGGNWLDFRHFENHNSVDREKFPEFNDSLRSAMFEEPVRFFVDVAQSDASILDFLYADHTFVNSVLASHYGIEVPESGEADWYRVDEAGQWKRGGMLPMAAFLTSNASGLRTSPVRRGYWVVRRVLGEHIPPPPPNVPELPEDEGIGDLSLRDQLSRHRNHKDCASCHEKFDSFGLVFEGYGPVGETRGFDLGARPVDDFAEFPNGDDGAGLTGLREYIRINRQDDFLDNLCRKMLSYGLGRQLILSDESTIQEMMHGLEKNQYRFSQLIEAIITSNQFRYHRSSMALSKN